MPNPNPPNNDVTPFRQPMVTSIGIMMGFLLNFVAGWATSDDNQPALNSAADYLVAGTMLLSLAVMILVLARLLNNRTDPETSGLRYQMTYKLYLSALLLAFAGFGAALLI